MITAFNLCFSSFDAFFISLHFLVLLLLFCNVCGPHRARHRLCRLDTRRRFTAESTTFSGKTHTNPKPICMMQNKIKIIILILIIIIIKYLRKQKICFFSLQVREISKLTLRNQYCRSYSTIIAVVSASDNLQDK